MKTMQSLLDIFQSAKDVLCKYDYYIYTPKRVLHLKANYENSSDWKK